MGVMVERDHVFATVDGVALGLDLYRASDDDAPVVVHVHGGGWRSGDKADDAASRLLPLAGYGVTVAAVNYRLVGTSSDRVAVRAVVHWFGQCDLAAAASRTEIELTKVLRDWAPLRIDA
jgi:acetyl esterase/lipase